MASVFTDLLRIRSLREERSERVLKEAQSRIATAEQAVVQAKALWLRFSHELPAKIDAEYEMLQQEAKGSEYNGKDKGTDKSKDKSKGVAMHRVQSFRSFESHMHTQREELRLALVEKQKALKEVHEAAQQAHDALQQAMRARMKIEQLQQQERLRQAKERERSEEKLLEEFQPKSVFAQLQ